MTGIGTGSIAASSKSGGSAGNSSENSSSSRSFVLAFDVVEVGHHLGERCGHAHLLGAFPGASPWRLAPARYSPLRPGPVVIAHVGDAEEMSRARTRSGRALADPE